MDKNWSGAQMHTAERWFFYFFFFFQNIDKDQSFSRSGLASAVQVLCVVVCVYLWVGCVHIVGWPLTPICQHTQSHTFIHTPTHTLDLTEIQTIICILPLCVSDTQTPSSGGITLAGGISEMSGAFLQPVIKNADTFTFKPPLEYHLSEVQ